MLQLLQKRRKSDAIWQINDWLLSFLTFPVPRRREKVNLNFYFHTSLWWFKGFYEGLKGLHKTFWGTTKKCENTNFKLIIILIQLSEMHGAGRSNGMLELLENFVSHQLFMKTKHLYEGLYMQSEKSVRIILREDFGWHWKTLGDNSWNRAFDCHQRMPFLNSLWEVSRC